MSEVLTLTTQKSGIILRPWLDKADDRAYFEAVDEDRDHLSQFGDATARKYPTIEAVTQRRLTAKGEIRLGIWDRTSLKGGITATLSEAKLEAEVGYWLRASAVGQGYATLAVQALTEYLVPRYDRVFAEVHTDNTASASVLQRSNYTGVGAAQRNWGPALIFDRMKGTL